MAEVSACPDRKTSSRAQQLLLTSTQNEVCIALLVLKNIFGFSVVLCKVKQKKPINLFESANIAQDIANELKCLREKAENEFHQLYIFFARNDQTQRFYFEKTTPYFKTDQSMQHCCCNS